MGSPCLGALGVKRSLLCNAHGDTPILGPALCCGIVSDRILLSITLGYYAIRGNAFAYQRKHNSLDSSLRELEIAISVAYIVGIAADLHAAAWISRGYPGHVVELLLRLRPELARSRVELEIDVPGQVAPNDIALRGEPVGCPGWHGGDSSDRRHAHVTEEPEETQCQRQDCESRRPARGGFFRCDSLSDDGRSRPHRGS